MISSVKYSRRKDGIARNNRIDIGRTVQIDSRMCASVKFLHVVSFSTRV